jgi:NADH-quinone oxidoreductase subunit J
MLLDSILFYAFAALIIFSAIMTITRRNVVHSAVWLISALVGVAGIYLLQGAEFLAGVQIIVYIGGIMVLFLFVIMLVPVNEESRQRRFSGQKWIAFLCSALLMAELGYFLSYGSEAFRLAEAAPASGIDVMTQNTEAVGQVLFSEYLLPFELASILLLVAMIGAVVMAKGRTTES